jgi:hypothetical protein
MKNKKAAMEMSVGTIVTIVLLMSVLVLGIFLIQNIFGGSQDAVDQINDQVQNEINKLFSEEGQSLAIFPNSREITLKQGESKGFAFSVNNKNVESHSYTWSVSALDGFDFVGKCGSGMTKSKADSFLLVSNGAFDLGGSSQMALPELVKLDIPETAPLCTIPYKLTIKQDGGIFPGTTIFVTIK